MANSLVAKTNYKKNATKDSNTSWQREAQQQEEDTDDEMKRMDFSVKPRFSQALHSKGHKGDISFSITDHSGDGA